MFPTKASPDGDERSAFYLGQRLRCLTRLCRGYRKATRAPLQLKKKTPDCTNNFKSLTSRMPPKLLGTHLSLSFSLSPSLYLICTSHITLFYSFTFSVPSPFPSLLSGRRADKHLDRSQPHRHVCVLTSTTIRNAIAKTSISGAMHNDVLSE